MNKASKEQSMASHMTVWLQKQGKTWRDVVAFHTWTFENWVRDATKEEILQALADGPMGMPDLEGVRNHIADMTAEELKQHQDALTIFWRSMGA